MISNLIPNLIAGGAVVLCVGGAIFYIYKSRKKGAKCIGCPYCNSCNSNSCGTAKDINKKK